MRRFSPSIVFVALLAPLPALASTTTDLVSQLAGLFYIIVGLALTVSIVLMLAGIVLWLLRLGTANTYRDTAIHIMEWSVAILFTLIIVLGIVEFVQTHTSATLYLIGIVIILLVIWLVATSGLLSGGGKDKEEEE